ncbi:MAG: glycosyltransferase family 4 protein [Deltaproteobacteria bacterium]|nr:glycosyltransferase family 4 protein [Deltaproteobacteria bacterium]
MRILLLGDTYLPERAAAAVRLSELASRWKERGHEVTVVTGNPHYPEGRIFPGYANKLFARDEVNGVPVHRVITVPYGRGAIGKRIINQLLFAFLPALLDRAGPADVVVASSPPLTIGFCGWLMALRRRVPLVFDVRDLYPDVALALGVLRPGPVASAFDWLARFTYEKSAAVVTATPSLTDALREKGVPAGKLFTVPNGANTERFAPAPRDAAVRARYGIAPDAFLAGYVGLMGRLHGAEVIIAAAEKLRDVPGLHFLLVGEGADRAGMEARARRMGLTNVTFGESVPAEEVPRVLNACDAGLATLKAVPLSRGALPVKIFEMMACGLPVAFAGWGGFEGILRDQGAGIVVPCEEPDALAGAVRTLASDPAAAREMGKKGRAFVEARFDRRALADTYLEILGKLKEG